MLECVINISEGTDGAILGRLAETVEDSLLDVHSDRHHNRSVFTLCGYQVTQDARRLASAAIDVLDVRQHQGVHPRIGVVDVVPFVPLPNTTSTMDDAIAARNDFAEWMARAHGVPTFLYGTEHTLPDVRRHAFTQLAPSFGPSSPHPTAGACAVGARPILIAFNIWLQENNLDEARQIATAVRTPVLRTLGLQVGDRVQVSCNLIEPSITGPADAFDAVNALAPVAGAELVGLLPREALFAIPPRRWHELDLAESKTIEARLSLH